MTGPTLEYSSGTRSGLSKFALVALTTTAVAAGLLALAAFEGTSDYDLIGYVSIPLAVVGALLALIATLRKSSRGVLAIVAVLIAIAYWGTLSALIVPKLLAGGFDIPYWPFNGRHVELRPYPRAPRPPAVSRPAAD